MGAGAAGSGLVGLAARLVHPGEVLDGRLNRLLGALWLTGGSWVLLGHFGGLADGGWGPGVLAVGVVAPVVGIALLSFGPRRLPEAVYVGLTVVGAAAISLTVLWGGEAGAAAYGIHYVYVTCFTLIALRRHAVWVIPAAFAMHVGALVVSDRPNLLGVLTVTWGAAGVTGLLAGAAVAWLEQAVAQVQLADGHRSRFVATVSHELRTPLAAILGSTETLRQRWELLSPEQRWQLVEVIDRQAGRQLRLVNDVLAVTTAMARSAPPEPTRTRVDDVLQEVAAEMGFAVRVEVSTPVHALVDPTHLQQMIENLLVNAHRYGVPPIELGAHRAGAEVVVEVVDHGDGLAGGLDGGLLEPFVQGDSGDRRSSAGVGLGLTICRDLAVANNGSLDYVDTPGGGATFRLHLPAD